VGDAAVTERLDATLDDYEVEGRKLERTSWSNQEVIFGTPISSASLEVQPVATDRLVNGDAAHHHSVRFVTHVDLHHSPPDVDVVVQPAAAAAAAAVAAVPDEPEPDYDSKDDDSAADGLPEPPLTGSVSGGQPPTPPPLPPPSSIGFTAGREVVRARVRSPEPAEVAAARRRDEAHAALMAAVQRRRNLLDSVDGDQIADSIENRVQRAKMLQTVYCADNGVPPAAAAASLVPRPGPPECAERRPVGLLAVGDPSTPPPATLNGDFTSEAERVRLEYVRRLQTSPLPPPHPPAKQPPPTKPLRSQPPATAPKSRAPVAVNEGHNRALAAYVNGGSTKVCTLQSNDFRLIVKSFYYITLRIETIIHSGLSEKLRARSTMANDTDNLRINVIVDVRVSLNEWLKNTVHHQRRVWQAYHSSTLNEHSYCCIRPMVAKRVAYMEVTSLLLIVTAQLSN